MNSLLVFFPFFSFFLQKLERNNERINQQINKSINR